MAYDCVWLLLAVADAPDAFLLFEATMEPRLFLVLAPPPPTTC